MAEVEQRTFLDGLLRECKHCAAARKTVEAMSIALKQWTIIGTRPDPQHDSDLNEPNVATFGPWRLDCDQCKNTGKVLTTKGRRLLGLLQMWLGSVHPSWAAITDSEVEQDAEIPF